MAASLTIFCAVALSIVTADVTLRDQCVNATAAATADVLNCTQSSAGGECTTCTASVASELQEACGDVVGSLACVDVIVAGTMTLCNASACGVTDQDLQCWDDLGDTSSNLQTCLQNNCDIPTTAECPFPTDPTKMSCVDGCLPDCSNTVLAEICNYRFGCDSSICASIAAYNPPARTPPKTKPTPARSPAKSPSPVKTPPKTAPRTPPKSPSPVPRTPPKSPSPVVPHTPAKSPVVATKVPTVAPGTGAPTENNPAGHGSHFFGVLLVLLLILGAIGGGAFAFTRWKRQRTEGSQPLLGDAL